MPFVSNSSTLCKVKNAFLFKMHMNSLLREAPLGQVVRWIHPSAFRYLEEREDFQLPKQYFSTQSDLSTPSTEVEEKDAFPGLHTPEKTSEVDGADIRHNDDDKYVLVDWYSEDDPDNPQNWPSWKKHLVLAQIRRNRGVIREFHISKEMASLGLAIYVLGCKISSSPIMQTYLLIVIDGVGPMIFSPISEVPLVGRNPPYLVSLALFLVVSIGTALVKNWPGFIVLRFFQGFFGSPGLATGGASLQDIYSMVHQPYALTVWMSAIYCGPSVAPLLASFAVVAKGWRWSMWEVVWMAGPIFILLIVLLPETSASNLLSRRARRLRKATGNDNLRSQSEIDNSNITVSKIFLEAIVKPAEIGMKDPALMFTNIYVSKIMCSSKICFATSTNYPQTMIVYGIYYSFFEAFPLVYMGVHGMSLTSTSIVFVCNVVGVTLGTIAYWSYLWYIVTPRMKLHSLQHLGQPSAVALEKSLIPALVAVIGPPVGLFIFAFTGTHAHISWIVPTIGITIFAGSSFVVFQCISIYVPSCYPQYAASLFAGNDFFRASFAAGAVMFAGPMFEKLGVKKGVSLLGGLSVLGIIGMWTLYLGGAWLRSKSKFALK